jgi:(+)-pinoresinol hydroxylase
MKRVLRAGGLVIGLLGTVLIGGAHAADSAGERIFAQWCAGCHADSPFAPATILLKQLRGPGQAVIEQRTDLNGASIRYLVRHGNGGMPSFRRTEISNADLDAIVGYLTQ